MRKIEDTIVKLPVDTYSSFPLPGTPLQRNNEENVLPELAHLERPRDHELLLLKDRQSRARVPLAQNGNLCPAAAS